MMSPYAGLDSPISIQSWGHQLKVDSADDKRIKQFADFLTLNNDFTPEPGASCENPGFIANPLVAGDDGAAVGDASADAERDRTSPRPDPRPRGDRDRTAGRAPPAARCGPCCWRSSRVGLVAARRRARRRRWASAGTTRPRPGLGRRRVLPGHGPHHLQGVEMANLAPDHSRTPRCGGWPSTSPPPRPTRSGRMQGWLALWGYSPTGGDADGLDGRRHGHGHGDMTGDAASCRAWPPRRSWPNLRSLQGTAFDVEFLRLMIRHHQGGLEMAAVRRRRTARPPSSARWPGRSPSRRRPRRRLMSGHAHRPGRHTRSRRPEARRPATGRRLIAFPACNTATSPRSSGDRALPSGGRGAGSNPAGGTLLHPPVPHRPGLTRYGDLHPSPRLVPGTGHSVVSGLTRFPAMTSAEIQRRPRGRIDLAYETFGDPRHPPVLLVMGLGSQMVGWPDELCARAWPTGPRVIRFDNRDVGRPPPAPRRSPRTC